MKTGVLALLLVLCSRQLFAAGPCGYVDDHGNQPDEATQANVDSLVPGTIEISSDRDVFEVSVLPYQPYAIVVTPVSPGMEAVELRVMDRQHNLLAREASTGTRVVAHVELQRPWYETLVLDVRSFAELSAGAYSLSVQALPIDDVDEDGLPDAFEERYGLSTASTGPDAVDGANGDWDEDGMSNLKEMYAGTDPMQASSVFRFTALLPDATGQDLSWSAVPGGRYRVQARPSVSGGTWEILDTLVFEGTEPGTMSIRVPTPFSGGPQQQYQVVFVFP